MMVLEEVGWRIRVRESADWNRGDIQVSSIWILSSLMDLWSKVASLGILQTTRVRPLYLGFESTNHPRRLNTLQDPTAPFLVLSHEALSTLVSPALRETAGEVRGVLSKPLDQRKRHVSSRSASGRGTNLR